VNTTNDECPRATPHAARLSRKLLRRFGVGYRDRNETPCAMAPFATLHCAQQQLTDGEAPC
jgi:hypothetical protein